MPDYEFVFRTFSQWDARWFLQISLHGYEEVPQAAAFFPLVLLLLLGLELIVRVRDSGLPVILIHGWAMMPVETNPDRWEVVLLTDDGFAQHDGVGDPRLGSRAHQYRSRVPTLIRQHLVGRPLPASPPEHVVALTCHLAPVRRRRRLLHLEPDHHLQPARPRRSHQRGHELLRTRRLRNLVVVVDDEPSPLWPGGEILRKELRERSDRFFGRLGDVQALAHLVREMRRFRPHIVHTHAWGTLCEGLVAARLARVPVMITRFRFVAAMRPSAPFG